MLKKSLLPAVAIVALLVIASSGNALDDSSNPPGSDTSPITEIEPEAREALTVLARGRRAFDALPGDLAQKLGEHADFGMNPDLSRLAIGNTISSVYLLPAQGHVCVALTEGEGAALTCPTTDSIANGEAGPATLGTLNHGIAIYGLVPDGVESVVVHTGTADTTELPTENNAYYTVLPSGTHLRILSYVGPSGPVEFPIVDPGLIVEDK